MKVIEGPTFNWKGRLTTTRLTERILASVKPMTITEGFATVTEKIVGTNNLRSIAVLEKMTQISRAVVHITIPGMGVATGFMIRPDVMMTNNHVFGSADDAKEAIIRFNYQIDLSGNFLPTDDYRCDVSFFHTNAQLDYSIVKLKGDPGLKWGYIQLPSDDTVKVQDDVFIIQHPGGEHKQIGLSDNEVAYVDDTVVQYLTDTMPGSSGSPVFNDSMRLIALHHSGGWLPEPSTGSTHFRNEGIRISAILKDMPKLG
ncbi:MAG: serine protease [Pseudomonadota bacterium]